MLNKLVPEGMALMSLTTITKMSSDNADEVESLSTRDSPLGSYYRWLLCDPTHKDYWATRATDREARREYPDKEQD
jgi:hypothetical protein